MHLGLLLWATTSACVVLLLPQVCTAIPLNTLFTYAFAGFLPPAHGRLNPTLEWGRSLAWIPWLVEMPNRALNRTARMLSTKLTGRRTLLCNALDC
jgi:hypothetical protein